MPFFGPLNDLHSEQEAPVRATIRAIRWTMSQSCTQARQGFLEKGFEKQDLKTRAGGNG
jgi:hypothetical protein